MNRIEFETRQLNGQIRNAIAEIQRLTLENKRITILYQAEKDKVIALCSNNDVSASIMGKELNKLNNENHVLLERIDFLTKKLREYGYFDKLDHEGNNNSPS